MALTSVRTLAALAGCAFALGSVTDLPAFGQVNRVSCSFNGRREPCTINRWANGRGDVENLAVTWLSDGKQTFYAFSGGGVQILEDNGRPTSGRWYREGNRYVIHSSRGNITVLPW